MDLSLSLEPLNFNWFDLICFDFIYFTKLYYFQSIDWRIDVSEWFAFCDRVPESKSRHTISSGDGFDLGISASVSHRFGVLNLIFLSIRSRPVWIPLDWLAGEKAPDWFLPLLLQISVQLNESRDQLQTVHGVLLLVFVDRHFYTPGLQFPVLVPLQLTLLDSLDQSRICTYCQLYRWSLVSSSTSEPSSWVPRSNDLDDLGWLKLSKLFFRPWSLFGGVLYIEGEEQKIRPQKYMVAGEGKNRKLSQGLKKFCMVAGVEKILLWSQGLKNFT